MSDALKLGPDAEVSKNTATLRGLIDQMCAAKNVFQGDGPPFAFIRTPPDAAGAVKTFVYVAFGTTGVHDEGTFMRGVETFSDALRISTVAFDAWLEPRRTLVWRSIGAVFRSTTARVASTWTGPSKGRHHMADTEIPPLTPIESSMFEGHHYEPNTRQLTVKFKNGAVHRYEDIPAEKHAALVESASPGRYFNDRIKNQFASKKL